MNAGTREAVAAELDAQAAAEDQEADVMRDWVNKLPAGSANHAQALGNLESSVFTAQRLRQRADQLRADVGPPETTFWRQVLRGLAGHR